MAAKYDMYIDQGSTFEITLKITDENGNLVDLTGHVFTGQVRKTISSPTIEFAYTFTIPPQVGDALGTVQISVAAAVTTALVLPVQNSVTRTPVVYAYDIESFYAGKTKRWLEGKVSISPEVTR